MDARGRLYFVSTLFNMENKFVKSMIIFYSKKSVISLLTQEHYNKYIKIFWQHYIIQEYFNNDFEVFILAFSDVLRKQVPNQISLSFIFSQKKFFKKEFLLEIYSYFQDLINFIDYNENSNPNAGKQLLCVKEHVDASSSGWQIQAMVLHWYELGRITSLIDPDAPLPEEVIYNDTCYDNYFKNIPKSDQDKNQHVIENIDRIDLDIDKNKYRDIYKNAAESCAEHFVDVYTFVNQLNELGFDVIDFFSVLDNISIEKALLKEKDFLAKDNFKNYLKNIFDDM